jgi:hypothetical protein
MDGFSSISQVRSAMLVSAGGTGEYRSPPTSVRSRTSLGAVPCAFALLAGACGRSSVGASSEVAAAGSTAEPTTAAAPVTSSQSSETAESPLADLLGIPFNDDAAEQCLNDLGRQAEIKIAECMLAQGFEYQVVDYSQIDALDSNTDFDSREFVEEYGFGIASNPFEESFEADPRIVGATTGWSSCMGEAGHNFSDQDGAEDDVRGRYNSIVANPDAFAEGDGSRESGSVVFEDGADVEEFVFGPQTLNPEFQAQVDELAVEERAIALASWDCNGPLREIEDDVRVEYEQRFADRNGAAIREALGE